MSAAVSLAGQSVPKGRYALFTIPTEDSWTIILNNEPDQFGAFSYDRSKDLLRFEVPIASTTASVETFEIAFQNVANNTAELALRWDDTAVAMPISVTEQSNLAQIQAEIERNVINEAEATWDNYGEAARFYVRENKDLEQAVAWYNKCNELNPEAFWLFYEKARVLADLGREDDAVAAVHAGIAAAMAINHDGGQEMGRGVLEELDGS